MAKKEHVKLLILPTLNNFPFIENDFDAVTYYQLLCKIVEHVNDSITLVNELADSVDTLETEFTELNILVTRLQTRLDTIEAELKEYIDTYIEQIRSEVNEEISELRETLETELTNTIHEFESELSSLQTRIESELSNFRTEVNELVARVDTEIALFKDYIDDKNELTYTELIAITNDLQRQINNLAFSLPTLYNPAKGNIDSIQNIINDYWIYLRQPNDLTAIEYDNINITAGEYDSLSISAREYDLNARQLVIKPTT